MSEFWQHGSAHVPGRTAERFCAGALLSGAHLGHCGSARHCGPCWTQCAVFRWPGLDLPAVNHWPADTRSPAHRTSSDAHCLEAPPRTAGELTAAWGEATEASVCLDVSSEPSGSSGVDKGWRPRGVSRPPVRRLRTRLPYALAR